MGVEALLFKEEFRDEKVEPSDVTLKSTINIKIDEIKGGNRVTPISPQDLKRSYENTLGSPVGASTPSLDECDPNTAKIPKLESKDAVSPEMTVTCGLCQSKPETLPLYGCKIGHYVCNKCRKAGGVLLSCPKCFDPELGIQLTELEERIFQQDCCFKENGCKQKLSEVFRVEHESDCEYRIVLCPNRLFSKSCNFSATPKEIREHGRTVHTLNKCYTLLDEGFITCKMLHSKDGSSQKTLYSEEAKFPPLEIEYDKKLFYCYYERKRRGLWFFFIRIYGSKHMADEYECQIFLGNGDSDKNSVLTAERHGKVDCVHYELDRQEIEKSGNCLTVDDPAIIKMNTGKAIFRIWWKIARKH